MCIITRLLKINSKSLFNMRYKLLLLLVCFMHLSTNANDIKSDILSKKKKAINYLMNDKVKLEKYNFVTLCYLNSYYNLGLDLQAESFIQNLSSTDRSEIEIVSPFYKADTCIESSRLDNNYNNPYNLMFYSLYCNCPYFKLEIFNTNLQTLYNRYSTDSITNKEAYQLTHLLFAIAYVKEKLNIKQLDNDIENKYATLITEKIINNAAVSIQDEYKVEALMSMMFAGYYKQSFESLLLQLIKLQEKDGSWQLKDDNEYTEKSAKSAFQKFEYNKYIQHNTIVGLWSLLAWEKLIQ